MLGQLPIEWITPSPIFDKVGVDYAGPVLIKYGRVRRSTLVKAYIPIVVSQCEGHTPEVGFRSYICCVYCLSQEIHRSPLLPLIHLE